MLLLRVLRGHDQQQWWPLPYRVALFLRFITATVLALPKRSPAHLWLLERDHGPARLDSLLRGAAPDSARLLWCVLLRLVGFVVPSWSHRLLLWVWRATVVLVTFLLLSEAWLR